MTRLPRAVFVLSATLAGCTAQVLSPSSSSSGATSSAASSGTHGSTASSTGGTTESSTATSTSSSSASTTTGTHGSSSSSSASATGTSSSTAGSSTSTTTGGTSSSSASSTTGGSTSGTSLGIPIDALIGLNAFISDPKDKLESFGTIREYHDWGWTDGNGAAGYPGYPNNQLEFSMWGGFWDFDDYYTQLTSAGSMVFPCIQGGVPYIENSALPPVLTGANDEDPASYVAHASFMFQYVARYGSVAVPHDQLKLDPSQTVKSGMNLLHYYENGNEPDNNWTHSDGSHLFSAEAIAAESSADYDGDQGRLGAGFGVKTADPNAKMVLAGLAMAGPSDSVTNATTYLDGIRAWAAANRGGSFPADVINFHYYCFGPDGYGVANPRPAKSPEDCGLSTLLGKLVAYRDQNLAGKEIWLTEFGYDTDPESNLRAPVIGGNSQQVVQGQWMVRSFLAIAEAGIDRATVFVSADGCSDGDSSCTGQNIQFATGGVLTEDTNTTTGWTQTAKTSYYFLATFRQALSGLSFAGTRTSTNGNVRVDAFADVSGKGAYVVWAPSSSAATVAGYALAVPGATTATEVKLVDQSTTGQTSTLTIGSGSVSVDVSETPTVILVDHLQ